VVVKRYALTRRGIEKWVKVVVGASAPANLLKQAFYQEKASKK